MAPPSKKGKGKAGGKGKNKKGKNQETSGNPVEPPPVQQQEQPSQPQVETEPQPAQSHEAESNPSIDSVPESPQNPEPVSEPESPQPVSEQASTALENLDPPQTSTNPDEDGSLQVASPDAPPDQQQILNDVQNILEATHESILEELAAPELPAEIVEATHEPISEEPAAPELPTESAEVTHEPISEEPVAPEPLAEIIEATHESILEELAAPEPLAESVEATPEPISEEPAAPEPVVESIAPEPLAEIIEATHESILEELAAPEPVAESVEATHEPVSEEPAVPEPPAESVEVTHEPSAPEPLAEIIEATHESILEELAAPEPLAESHEPTSEEPVAPEPLVESVEATREPILEEPSAPEPLAEVIEATHESILEELAAPEPLAESVEANVEKVNGLGDTAEPPEPTPVTAPQTPLLPTAATSIPPPSPSLAEAQRVAETLRSNAGSPAPNHFSEAEAGISVPQQEPTPPTEQATSLAADPASPLKPVLPPALPAAFSGPESFTPAFSAASKPASPATQFASPVYQPASPAFRTASLASHPPSPIQRPESPQYRAPSPAYRAASPAQKTTPMAKAISKTGSPLVHAYMSPAMSPHAMPPPPPPSMPPSIPPGYVTAYSPVLSSAGYLPPYAPYYHQPSPNILPAPRGSIDPHYASTFQALRDMGLSNGNANGNGVNEKGTISPPHEHDEPIELLQRIQDAIPDINRLLTGYRNTKSKLAAREAEFKQMQSQHEQALMHKDFYIEALQNQMKKAANESAEETTRLKNNVNELRMELGNLDEKRKDLEENLAESEKFNKELLHVKADLEGQVATLTANMREAQEAHEKELERREEERIEGLATQKQELTELFEEIKAEDEKAAAEALAAREKELLDQQESMRQQMQDSHDALQSEFDAKVTVLESTEAELASTKEELGSTIAELDSTKTELDGKVAELEATQTELSSTKTALEDKQKELDETREQNANEIAQLKQSHEETVTELETRITEKCAELANSEQENKKLEEDNLQKEKQLEHAVGGMRTTIDNLGKDCDRLRKTLHSIGEATDLKSTKGDTFFLDCFDQLSRLIVFLSKEHFTYLPIDPPKDVLSKIPPELPSFLDNTPASRELRSAYVQHVISKTLTYRIFQPFLFTLGRRYDKADTFFQMLSMDIRRKSVRREAFWRQQTLKAAYTTSDAKQSINVVAAVIVDEIIDHIKHFADPRHLDTLLIGVRKIVKLAAETWRLARVERELILATLPAPDAEGVSNDGWSEYGTPKEGSLSSKDHPSRHVILRTFPQIAREAAHEDFAEDEEKISPCVYSRGVVLYSDSPVVMARLQELAKKSTETLSGGEESPRARSRGVRSD